MFQKDASQQYTEIEDREIEREKKRAIDWERNRRKCR